ncbi:hypothetical protein MCEMIEM13_01810 [Comamonadaceae bacterium]
MKLPYQLADIAFTVTGNSRSVDGLNFMGRPAHCTLADLNLFGEKTSVDGFIDADVAAMPCQTFYFG